ncbi:MAG: alpha-galactosidase [Pseudomonadota bacterium]
MSSNTVHSLHSSNASFVVDCTSGAPVVLYWGGRLDNATTPEMLRLLSTPQEAQASVTNAAPIALSPALGIGFHGDAGLRVHRNGCDWGVTPEVSSCTQPDDQTLEIRCIDRSCQIELHYRLSLDADSDTLSAQTCLKNLSATLLQVDRCDAPALPVANHLSHITAFKGRWAHEFQTETIGSFHGSFVRENQAGRTSHDSFPGLIVHDSLFGEHRGEGIALTLGWSGNHRMSVTRLISGRALAQLGEHFYPGEMQLGEQETYESPILYSSVTETGMTPLSQRLHRYVRSHLTDARMHGKLKPVHFNTWEAMYFDLDTPRLCALADAAASVGAERFVLDDGWFPARHDDTAGLGDWTVDAEKFPRGLQPLIDHVHALGMEFGLWVEPEMVNPNSQLFRDHPDWVLSVDGAPTVLARNQLVLDLSRPEVCEYLYAHIDALLQEYPITYLKWDMNRDLHQPGDQHGRAAVHRQVLAVYALMDRIRAAHPNLEIESCSSGGARADYGVLAHTDRIWTSDSNDALDRLRIQRGCSMFFPPEFMGAHVGPRECHITGRTLSMALRAGVAIMGDMGIEANITEMSSDDRNILAAAIALHKQHRKLIFTGDIVRLETQDFEMAHGVVAADREEALFSYAVVSTPPHSAPGRLRLHGLDADRLYEANIVWPEDIRSHTPSILDVINGKHVSGDSLMRFGLQLPILKPETLLLLHLQVR